MSIIIQPRRKHGNYSGDDLCLDLDNTSASVVIAHLTSLAPAEG